MKSKEQRTAWQWLRSLYKGVCNDMCMFNERRCALCLTPFVSSAVVGPVVTAVAPFCVSCLEALLRQPRGRCPHCGLAMPAEGAIHCGRCLQYPPPWEAFSAVGPYQKSLRELLIRGKFRADSAALHGLGTLMALCVQQQSSAQIHAIVPMPLHPARLRERGFNQCVELARPIARLLELPICTDLLTRQIDTPHQRGLNAQERRRNLRGAFVAGNVEGKRVLLVDDVMTTGTTLRLAAKVLLSAGAAVDVIAAARA